MAKKCAVCRKKQASILCSKCGKEVCSGCYSMLGNAAVCKNCSAGSLKTESYIGMSIWELDWRIRFVAVGGLLVFFGIIMFLASGLNPFMLVISAPLIIIGALVFWKLGLKKLM